MREDGTADVPSSLILKIVSSFETQGYAPYGKTLRFMVFCKQRNGKNIRRFLEHSRL